MGERMGEGMGEAIGEEEREMMEGGRGEWEKWRW